MFEIIKLIVSLGLIAGGIVSAVRTRKVLWMPLVVILIGSIYIFYTFFNVATSKKDIIISNNTMQKIASVNWDAENLKDLGFEQTNDCLALRSEPTIWVRKCDEIPKDTKEFSGIKYSFKEGRLGLLDIYRLWNKENPTTRAYYIYTNGYEIYMFEHANEGEPSRFEEIISHIYTLQQSG